MKNHVVIALWILFVVGNESGFVHNFPGFVKTKKSYYMSVGRKQEAQDYKAKVLCGKLKLPSRTTVQSWAVKVDLLLTEFHAEILNSAGRIDRHASADSSPQCSNACWK